MKSVHVTRPAIVAFGALALVASVARATPAAGAETSAAPRGAVLAIGAIAPADLAHLPDATPVTFAGKTITLGQLRAAHEARLQRFSMAASLGSEAAMALVFHGNGTAVAGLSPVIEPLTAADVSTYAKDYQTFCLAARATVCGYLPAAAFAGEALIGIGEPLPYYDVDPLVTDSATCASQNGSLDPDGNFPGFSGCFYAYPSDMRRTLPATSPLSFTKACTAGFYPPVAEPFDARVQAIASSPYTADNGHSYSLILRGSQTETCVEAAYATNYSLPATGLK